MHDYLFVFYVCGDTYDPIIPLFLLLTLLIIISIFFIYGDWAKIFQRDWQEDWLMVNMDLLIRPVR